MILEAKFKDNDLSMKLDIVSRDDYNRLQNMYEKSNVSNSMDKFKDDIQQQFKNMSESINVSNKKTISVKEFEDLYSIGEETQRKLRGRRNDPLPYIQIAKRGSVLYNPDKIDKWLENYYKERN